MRIFKFSIVIACVLFLVMHIALTLLYVLPENITSRKLKGVSKRYMTPLFDQSWSLFAPVPEVNKKVFVNCLESNGSWGGWEAPFDKYLRVHQESRVGANSKIVLMQSNTLHYLYYENASDLKLNPTKIGDSNSGYYKVLRHEVERELATSGRHVSRMKLLVVFTKASCSEKQISSIYYPAFETAK